MKDLVANHIWPERDGDYVLKKDNRALTLNVFVKNIFAKGTADYRVSSQK